MVSSLFMRKDTTVLRYLGYTDIFWYFGSRRNQSKSTSIFTRKSETRLKIKEKTNEKTKEKAKEKTMEKTKTKTKAKTKDKLRRKLRR